MTRPHDYDLGTGEGIARTVEAMYASSAAAMTGGGHYCVRPSDDVAYQYATEAAHHARRLQGVAHAVWMAKDLGL